jgi:glyoxylase-like metal-dependent hydrolase (beta-lactamase superfamily II)
MRDYPGNPVVPALRAAGFDPATVDVVAMGHLHFDHAGGLLLADGSRAFARARIVAQRAEWEIALGGNSRLVASYDQPELRLVADWGAQGWSEGDRELLPGVSVVRTGGHSAGHQAIVVRGTGPGARTLAFFGDLCMRPWAANPRWVTAFDDFPLDSVEVKASCSAARSRTTGWSPVARGSLAGGHARPDRDRFRFEDLEDQRVAGGQVAMPRRDIRIRPRSEQQTRHPRQAHAGFARVCRSFAARSFLLCMTRASARRRLAGVRLAKPGTHTRGRGGAGAERMTDLDKHASLREQLVIGLRARTPT